MMDNLNWEVVKEFYKERFGLDGWVVEMYANMDVLILCASGASNQTIETFLEIPIYEIKKVIEEAFDFEGWDKDLPINPYKIFCTYDGKFSSLNHFSDFCGELAIGLGRYSGFEAIKPEKIFYICETMYDIERKIQDEWI